MLPPDNFQEDPKAPLVARIAHRPPISGGYL